MTVELQCGCKLLHRKSDTNVVYKSDFSEKSVTNINFIMTEKKLSLITARSKTV